MKLLRNLIFIAISAVTVSATVSFAQPFSATETAERGVEALLQTVQES